MPSSGHFGQGDSNGNVVEADRMNGNISDDELNGNSCDEDMNGNCDFEQVMNGLALEQLEPNFGLLFDVDGVIGRGSVPLEPAKQMIHRCVDDDGKLKVPMAFVTNSCSRNKDKAAMLTRWLGVEITPDQVIHAQGALSVFKKYHDKHVLFIGQGKIKEIANDLGFTNICTIDDIKDSYPLLDIVDHSNRVRIATHGYTERHDFPKIEAMVLVGEPNRWESNLQLMVDLLLTGGKPNYSPHSYPEKHIPVLACNMDLTFMAEACMPRFGHGAYLTCLEALYKKITGRDLEYTALVGKPSEITYRYAEHVITEQARKLGINSPIKTMYFVGDNPEADIVGANLYDCYIRHLRENNNMETEQLSPSRCIPKDAEFYPQTVEKCVPILVGTGVFNPKAQENNNDETSTTYEVYHGHRDFVAEPTLKKPAIFVDNVLDAVNWAMSREGFSSA